MNEQVKLLAQVAFRSVEAGHRGEASLTGFHHANRQETKAVVLRVQTGVHIHHYQLERAWKRDIGIAEGELAGCLEIRKCSTFGDSLIVCLKNLFERPGYGPAQFLVVTHGKMRLPDERRNVQNGIALWFEPIDYGAMSNVSIPRALRRPPFFIVGAARSGTTLLQQMLDHHPDLAVPRESYFIPVISRYLAAFGNLSKPENRLALIRAISEYMKISYSYLGGKEWVPNLDREAPALAAQAGPSYGAVIDEIFSLYAKETGKTRWGDKSPMYINHLDLLLGLFPDAQFVHLIRDGRDVAASVLPLSFGPMTVTVAAETWGREVRCALEFEQKHPTQVLAVRFEDLLHSTEATLRRICAFLGHSFDPRMLEFHRDAWERMARMTHHIKVADPVDPAREGRWTRDLTATQIRVYESVAGDVLAELGYKRNVAETSPSSARMVMDHIVHWMLLFRPFTSPLGLGTRIQMFARRMLFRGRLALAVHRRPLISEHDI